MNDYPFGNYIYEKRRAAGLSQAQVGALVGVSAKAVSKWENGRSKPTTETLKKLALLYGASIEELLQMKRERPRAQIHKIVLTGGPCAGKTTAMSWIQNAFTKLGYRVLFIPETATELISGGVAPGVCRTNTDFQLCLARLQMEKERVFEYAAKTMDDGKILIVCDRGALDNRAYMTGDDFRYVLEKLNTSEVELRDH